MRHPRSLPNRPLNERERAALELLAEHPRRSSELAGLLGLPLARAVAICASLARVALAQAVTGADGRHWRLTPAGRVLHLTRRAA